MPAVQMPTGEIVDMPDNPTPQQLAELELIMSPSGPGGAAPSKAVKVGGVPIVSERGIGGDLAHGAGLAARTVLTGLTGASSMIADLPFQVANLFNAKQQLPSQAQNAMMDKYFGEPQGAAEKAAVFGGSLLLGSRDPLMVGATKAMGGPVPAATHPLAEKSKTFADARKLGYVATPGQAQAKAGSRATESIVGKGHLEQMAAAKNQSATNRLFTREAGLPPGTPLTNETVQNAIRATYNAGYGPIERIPVITNGGIYRRALDKALIEHQGMSRSFPDAAKPEVANLINAYRVKSFSGEDAVRAIQVLRDDASAAFAKGEGSLGKANLAVARAIEDSIELNLKGAGKDAAGILRDFRGARAAMAKQYAVKDSLVEGSGSGDLHKLVRQLKQNAPLTGDLLAAAKFGNTAPNLTRYPKSPPGLLTTPESYMLGSAAPAGLLSGNWPTAATMASIPLARAGIRAGMLTSPYQTAFVHPNIDPNILQRLQQHPGVINAMPTAYQLGSGLFGQ